MTKLTTRLAVTATASLAAFGLAASASAASADAGDPAILSAPGAAFRLAPGTMEPGCSLATQEGSSVAAHVDVTQSVSEAHVSVDRDANFSVDQILVPGTNSGYAVYNRFDTGSNSGDADIDPGQTATDLAAPGGSVDPDAIVVCINDHPDAGQNEPYVSDGLPGEVAAINRPVVQPTIAALGVSADNTMKTYKVGFGYKVERGYDLTWVSLLGGGDPNARESFTKVEIPTQVKQDGVRRYNDIDEFGEAFSEDKAFDYGQPTVFDLAGDPYAYLHNQDGLVSFTTEGDLPISWKVKPSLAPEAYGRTVTLTDDMLRAWNASWQDYYAGSGPKPATPLAPGTDSPAISPSITVVVNQQETRPTVEPQRPMTTTNNTTIVNPPAIVKAAAKGQRTKVHMVRLMHMKGGRRGLQVFVSSSQATARIQFRMYAAGGRKVAQTSKTVRTNHLTLVRGVHIAKQVKTVKATVK
jgi:hypothetical protein